MSSASLYIWQEKKRTNLRYIVVRYSSVGLKQRNINNVLLSSEAFKQIVSTVNVVPLEQFGANSVNQCYGSTGAVSSKLSTRITKQKALYSS